MHTSEGNSVKRIYVPTTGPDDWRRGLAQPRKHWKTGHSARTLAYCWEETDELPREIAELFVRSGILAFRKVELLLAVPEYKVALPGSGKASQNDLFVLLRDAEGQLVVVMVEGKVSESFGPMLQGWNKSRTPGKLKRLKFIQSELRLPDDLPRTLRYQLLHRTVSAVLEARRFNALKAVILVHSFSQSDEGLEDYQRFVRLFDVDHSTKDLLLLRELDRIQLYAGWANGDVKFLRA